MSKQLITEIDGCINIQYRLHTNNPSTEAIINECMNHVQKIEEFNAIVNHYQQSTTTIIKKHYYDILFNEILEKLKKAGLSITINRKDIYDIVDHILIEMNCNNKNILPKKHKFLFIDLFAGIGGFRLSAQQAGGHCVFSSEWDSFAKKTYETNFMELPFGDITKTSKFIPKNYDLLCAGFPCQPFSYAGLKHGFDETRGTLFFDILQILEDTKPKMFLLENVKGLKSHDGGKTLETIEKSLRHLGYTIKWKIINSYDFGLPQYRERWYCVGFKEKIDFEFPSGNMRGAKLRNIIDLNSNMDNKLKLSESEIERINFHFSSNDNRVQHDNSKYHPNTKKGRHGVFSFQKSDGSLRFHIGDKAKTQIQEAFYTCQDTYAPTIIANRVPKLWDLQRKLSVLEAKRLQGFPDNFIFPVSDNQAYKQLGNSVGIPVVEAIIKKMLKSI